MVILVVRYLKNYVMRRYYTSVNEGILEISKIKANRIIPHKSIVIKTINKSD